MAKWLSVGVHVHAEPQRLLETLRALEREGVAQQDILLLGDGPDPPTRQVIAGLGLRESSSELPGGPPACFNRLATESDTDTVILLESGAIPAPGAIERLLAALKRNRGAGLAGPSTNSSWNEQGAFPRRTGTGADIARTGEEAARRFGDQTRSLAPLHSLSDFCYAVTRKVILAIGGADEGYGLGPCWEMDFNARAARAGFDGLWVCGAYVWRAPFTPRRRLEERRGFAASRRRYQDNLCGLRLRGEADGYQDHCLGERCAHFAPRELIGVHRPLSAAQPAAPTAAGLDATPTTPVGARGRALVSCIMPTRNRAEFVLQAIRLFQRQDYPARELIVVDDGDDDLSSRLPEDPHIRLIRAPRGESIGAKRNRACQEARGAFIAQWDDDDWYGSRRLSVQLEPLLAGRADISGLRLPVFFELESWRFWTVDPGLNRRLFVHDVHGGTLVFSRRVWERLARYPSRSLAEDAAFLTQAVARGARLAPIDDAGGVFVYLRHASNAWRFACGAHVDPTGWRRVPEPALPAADRAFYGARSRADPAGKPQPLVSCIMPTADRRPWVSLAIAYFQRQDYPDKELVILDDGDDRVADLIPDDPRIRYVALDERMILGEKRNHACELAHGEIVVHWDDDDWHAPNRLSYQVRTLVERGAPLCGIDRVRYFDPVASRAWLYAYAGGGRPWVAGNTLCYQRSLWRENRFPPVATGEDTRFVWGNARSRPLVLDDNRFFVAVMHGHNSSRKLTAGPNWTPRPTAEVRALVGADWEHYRGAATEVGAAREVTGQLTSR